MARTRSTRMPVDERRSQLLAVGLELFAVRPYDDIAIDDIARAAGISKGLLYHYFGSKRAFYIAIIESAAQELLARTFQDPGGEPLTRVANGLDAYVAYVTEHADAYSTLMRGGLGSDAEVAAIVEETRHTILNRMLEGLGSGRDNRRLRIALRGWIGFIEAACLDWLEHDDVPREWLLELMRQIAFDAVRVVIGSSPVST